MSGDNEKNLESLLGLNDPSYIINKIQKASTIGELNYMRLEILKIAVGFENKELFEKIQKTFIDHQNNLKRVPLSKRGPDWEVKREIKIRT